MGESMGHRTGQSQAAVGAPIALTIAGSDSIGGAGLQADLKTFAALGCHGTSAVTAITAQNTRGVRAAEAVAPALIAEQIDAVAEDTDVAATKTGMLSTAAGIEVVAQAVERYRLAPLVVDPVMVAKSGDPLIDAEAVEALTERLLPLATVITPNRHEAVRLLEGAGEAAGGGEQSLTSVDAAADAARTICHRYDTAVCVVTGIRRSSAGGMEAVDVCCHGEEVQAIAGPWHEGNHVHGSGCVYSAAITGALAHGSDLEEALQTARRFITRAISQGLDLGHGPARPVNPISWQAEAIG